MRAAEPRARLVRCAELERRLAARAGCAIPLLVIRLPALERTAWREGLRTARRLERSVSNTFATAAAGVLRAGDVLAHERGTDIFLAALTAPMREGAGAPAAIDARSALARIGAMMESASRLDVESGWTTVHSGERAVLPAAVARALACGAQERERYAFFSALGHELRTPLASIRGYLETLLDGDVDPATRGRFVTIAYKESLRLSRLVEGMFEISMLDLHATPRERSVAPLDRVLVAAADACSASAAARGVRVRLPCLTPLTVQMHADRLTLVLINLIENAVKHGRPGGTVAVHVDARDERCVRIAIDDDGPGIAPADRKRLFSVGERGATSAPGSGLGLALVRLILERDGGGVDVGDSVLGGAQFVVTVSRAAHARAGQSAQA